MDQRERDIESLRIAATEILEYVTDPGERPRGYDTMDAVYRQPKSPAQIAREQADRLESQSRAVRNLKHILSLWSSDQPR